MDAIDQEMLWISDTSLNSVNHLRHCVYISAFIFIASLLQQNDDEAERAQRRRTFGKASANNPLSNESLVEEQQGLQNCLKIFHDNVSELFNQLFTFCPPLALNQINWSSHCLYVDFVFCLSRKSARRMRGLWRWSIIWQICWEAITKRWKIFKSSVVHWKRAPKSMDYVSIPCTRTLCECLPASVAWKVSHTISVR